MLSPDRSQHEGFSFTPGMAFQIAATTLVGQSLVPKIRQEPSGWDGKQPESEHLLAFSRLESTFLRQYLAFLYTDDPTVMDLAAGRLKIIALINR